MELKKIGVIGLGAMGAGIAQVTALAGYPTLVCDAGLEITRKALEGIRESLTGLSRKGRIPPDQADKAIQCLTPVERLAELSLCDLVIEAVAEDFGLKKKLFGALEKAANCNPIYASNTSSLSITELCAGMRSPERFIGLHFFYPAQIMKLVEVIRTPITDPCVVTTAQAFAKSIGKVPVLARDRGGFLVNLLLTPFLFDAMRALDEGVAGTEDIDKAMVLGCGHPVGPLKLADMIGLDILVSNRTLFDEFKEKRFSPPAILKRLTALGFLGKKSGKGFYDWSDPQNPVPIAYL